MKQKLLKTLSAVLCASLCLSFAACGDAAPAPAESVAVEESQEETTPDPAPAPAQEEEEVAAPSNEVVYPITITDALGREVTINEEPKTLVSGYYISSSVLIALGLQDKMVGIEAKADKRNIYKLSAPALCELPSVGSAKQFDLEACAALLPDLLIVPKKVKDNIPALEELGITTIAVNPEDDKQLFETIDILGKATNRVDAANKLTAYIEAQKSALADALSAVTEKTPVYFGGNGSLLSTAGPAMFQSTLLSWAGAENVAAEIEDTYWAEVSYEQILAWNPAAIVIAADAEYSVEDVLADPALAEVTAVKEGKVFQIPSGIEAWDSPVPGCILGSLWIAANLYPEQFSMDAFETAKTEFYSTFYGFTE